MDGRHVMRLLAGGSQTSSSLEANVKWRVIVDDRPDRGQERCRNAIQEGDHTAAWNIGNGCRRAQVEPSGCALGSP